MSHPSDGNPVGDAVALVLCKIKAMEIRLDDLSSPAVVALLCEHLVDMASSSPPESCHALDLEGLKATDVAFWTLWQCDELAGCGALKRLDAQHAEIKSMRTASAFHRKGIASQILEHLIREASERAYARLSLETGSMAYFEPARRLYAKFGFQVCSPFANYIEDPNSVFMTRTL